MTRIARILVLAVAPLLCKQALAQTYSVGSWSVVVAPDRAVAATDDPGRTWTLMVRCVEGHLDVLIRPHAAPFSEQGSIRHYAGSLSVDGGSAIRFPAQTWSLNGFLVPDAGPVLPSIEAAQHLDFVFRDGSRTTGASSMSFLALDTKWALQPVRRRCEVPES